MRFNLLAALATFALLLAGGVLALWMLTPEPSPPCEAAASHCPGDAYSLAESVLEEGGANRAGGRTD